MSSPLAGRDATGVVSYTRLRPEQTLLYQIVEHYYPAFSALRAAQDRALPAYVQREFEDFLKCGRLEHGFLRVRCERCHDEKLVAFSCYLEPKTMRSTLREGGASQGAERGVFSARKTTDPGGAGCTRLPHQRAGRALSGTARTAGAGYGEQLSHS